MQVRSGGRQNPMGTVASSGITAVSQRAASEEGPDRGSSNHDQKARPEAYQHLYALDNFLKESRLDPVVWGLVKIRASQINGCAFCVDMHAFAAQRAGERLERLFAVAAWREAPFFTDTERAALALTEAATVVEHGHVADEVWDEAAAHFNEDQLAALVLAIGLINMWNRIAVTTLLAAGSWRQPAAPAR